MPGPLQLAAGFVALAALGLPDLADPWWATLIPWVAPFPAAFIAIALIQQHYRRKFAVRGGVTQA